MPNDTTESFLPTDYRNHLYVSPEHGWKHSIPIQLTPEMINAIEYIVIRIPSHDFEQKIQIEVVIDGVRYWDIAGKGMLNKFVDWEPIIKQFPINIQIECQQGRIWAACKGWQE